MCGSADSYNHTTALLRGSFKLNCFTSCPFLRYVSISPFHHPEGFDKSRKVTRDTVHSRDPCKQEVQALNNRSCGFGLRATSFFRQTLQLAGDDLKAPVFNWLLQMTQPGCGDSGRTYSCLGRAAAPAISCTTRFTVCFRHRGLPHGALLETGLSSATAGQLDPEVSDRPALSSELTKLQRPYRLPLHSSAFKRFSQLFNSTAVKSDVKTTTKTFAWHTFPQKHFSHQTFVLLSFLLEAWNSRLWGPPCCLVRTAAGWVKLYADNWCLKQDSFKAYLREMSLKI